MRAKISTETWAQLKIAYASGIGLREMARNMNIPEGTVLSRAQREGWTPSIASVKGSGKARGFPNDGTLRAAVELCIGIAAFAVYHRDTIGKHASCTAQERGRRQRLERHVRLHARSLGDAAGVARKQIISPRCHCCGESRFV